MTFKEENIVNISMMAAELLKDGRIERDDISGHVGLTDTIISLAERFEKENVGVDWDAEGRDYWLEIDHFAEKELMEKYGIVRDPREQELNVKVIIFDGIVEGVLKDANIPVSVEIVDVDRNYENYKALDAYREEIYKDKSLIPCDYAFAGQEEVLNPVSLSEDPVKVYAVAGSVKLEIFSGNLDECKAFCEENRWRWIDENTFEWDLEIEDSRDDLLPEDYFDALSYYSKEEERDIESEFIRLHADKLTVCYHNELSIEVLDRWARFEELCGESLTYDEYKAVADVYDGSPYEIGDEEFEVIDALKRSVKDFRAAQTGPNKAPELEQLIQAAEDQKQAPDRASGKSLSLDR